MAQELRQAGWTKARALVGGWHTWQVAGLPVEGLRLTQDEALEQLVRLYRGVPERQRAGLLAVVEAAAKALSA